MPLVDDGVHDAQGVRMFLIGTTQFNHPVAQAQYGLANLSSYALTNNATFLNRAIAQANRLLSLKVASRGAWFFPYPFNFALHGIAADTMVAPWYSGMAQGQALSLFVRTINPRHFIAMAELGEMLEDYGDKAGALKLYRRVLTLDPQMKVAAERAKALTKEVEGQGI